ncbi:hypothetical protein BDV93DRAFT_555719 [Ceratobasidium sp. AG-I]|nr:hypothetical protein BDV93DRAFT_555719 [Ceratobasidium sp. AG-I]
MHFDESMLKSGSIYKTHVWAMERVNGIVSKIKHNGKTKGVLEGTLMQGWWSYAMLQNLITALSELPNRTPADNEVLVDLLKVLQGRVEDANQRGSLIIWKPAKT